MHAFATYTHYLGSVDPDHDFQPAVIVSSCRASKGLSNGIETEVFQIGNKRAKSATLSTTTISMPIMGALWTKMTRKFFSKRGDVLTVHM